MFEISLGFTSDRAGRGRIRGTICSQTMAEPGVSSLASWPEDFPTDAEGDPVFSLYSSEDAYFAIGADPDPILGARRFLAAKTSIDILGSRGGGDRVAWTFA